MKKKMTVLVAALVCGLCAFADITISPSSIDYAVGGGGAAIKTSGSGSWTATSDADWITVVKSSGEAGTACTYIVSRNNDADSREGHITISGNIYTVTQKGCPVELSPASATFGKTGGSGIITASVDAGVAWTASPSDKWITVTPVSGSGAAELSYTVAAYDAVGSRTGTIRIGSEKFTITQVGVEVTLSPVATNVTKDVCIVPLQVVALTETTWTVTPQVSWISVLDGGTGHGGSQVSLAIAENPSFERRTGTVTIGSATFTVVQSGTDDVNFKILPEVATASPLGAFANVAVYATPDASWAAESMDSWIKITEGEEGAGNGNVKYVTMSNPELTSRTGRIKFTPPVYTPELDLYSGLLFWIKDQYNIEGNEARQTTYPLSKAFDGTFKNTLTGAKILNKGSVDFTLSFSFKLGSIDRLNRLLRLATLRNFYFSEDNRLYSAVLNGDGSLLKTVATDFVADADKWYTIVIRQDNDRFVSIYAGLQDTELPCVSQYKDTKILGLDQSDISMDRFEFGYAIYPSTGSLQSGQFANIRFWSRALTDLECKQVDTAQGLGSGLLLWIENQANIEGNAERKTTLPLSTTLNGSNPIGFSGAELPKNDKIDFSFAVSFKLGSLNRINQLFMLGNGDNARHFYFDSANKLHYDYGEYPRTANCTVPSANEWYTLLVTQKSADSAYDGGAVSIYFGRKGSELSLVHQQGEGSFLQYNCRSLPIADCFTLGRTLLPSAGNLQSGQFANVRFWTRALNDTESKRIDMKQDVMLESSPAGAPEGVAYNFFPLNGNMYGSDGVHVSRIGLDYNVGATGWTNATGRLRTAARAIGSAGNGSIKFSDAARLFGARNVVNDDLPFPSHAGRKTSEEINSWGYRNYHYYSAEPYVVNGCTEATYVFWISFSEVNNSTVFYRSRIYKDGTLPGTVDDELKMSLCSNGNLKLQGSGISTTEFPCGIVPNAWYMIALTGKNQNSLTVYVNGKEVGNIASKMTIGTLVALDTREFHSYYYSDSRSVGEVVYPKLVVGGWKGIIDEMAFYETSLSGKQIKDIYEAGLPFQDVYHTVNQGIQQPTITPEYVAASKFGGTTNIALSVARAINWSATPNANWLSIVGATSGTGPANVMVKVAANPTCDPRIGTVTIGTKKLTVEQAALNCEIEADQTVFPTEAGETGGMGIISVSPEGNGSWTAESDVDWIYCYPESGTGSYDVYFFVEDMGSTAASRSGKITIGGKTIEITQRGYDLSIDPQICEVGGNAGAGVIGVAADAGAVWTAIADVPWITIVQTTDKFVHYTYTDNTTGETRIGHINISGEEYELRQTCKLDLNTTVVGKGTVTGGGKYAQGVTVSLKATPANGYEFSHWSGDVVGVESDTSVIMDTVKNVTATFIPEAAAQVLAEKKAAQGGFYTRDQIHNLELGNLVLDVDSATGKARIGVQLQETSDLSNPNWQPVEVTTSDLDVGKDGTVGIKAKATGNGMFYRVVVPKK